MTSLTSNLRLEENPLVREFPRLTRFYGISFAQLAEMPRWAILHYLEEMPALFSEEQGAAIQAASFPHMDEKARRRVVRRMERLTAPEPVVDTTEMPKIPDARVLAGLGIKLVEEGVSDA